MRISHRKPGALRQWLRWTTSQPAGRFLVLVALLLAAFTAGVLFDRQGLADSVQTALVEAPQRLKAEMFSPVERLTIDLSHVNFTRLTYERELAIQRGVLVQEEGAYVSSKIRFQDRSYSAKMRLKGDLADQFAGDHWAFRVKLTGDEALLGMQVFSLHQPSARNFVYEWILHQMMREESIIGLRYLFVELVLNGANLGVYALEEHFEKRLIESNHRPEGPIVAISEAADIETIRHFGWPTQQRVGYDGPPIQVYREQKTLADEGLRGMYRAAHDLLAEFLAGARRADEVFDVEKLARYYAVLDLTNGRHAAKYGNLKFYYNPITSRLEPICFDAEFVGLPVVSTYGGGISAETWRESDDELDFLSRLFVDPTFFARYIRELERLGTREYLEAFFSRNGSEIERLSGIVRRSTPSFTVSYVSFFERARWIQRFLGQPYPLFAFPVTESLASPSRVIAFDVINVSSLHLVVDGFQSGEKKTRVEEPIVIPAAARHMSPSFRRISFPAPATHEQALTPNGAPASPFSLLYRVAGSSQVHSAAVAAEPRLVDPERLKDLSRQAPNPRDFPFLRRVANNIYRFDAGSWQLDRSLALPTGAALEIGPGTSLSLTSGASIIARGPLRFLGSAEAGIRIDATGDNSGILLLGATELSRFEYVAFSRLGAPRIAGIALNGAITVYESPAQFRYCVFSESRAEDALNIVRSKFDIQDSAFERTASDALDSDYSIGRIARTKFLDLRNDGIDASGSSLELKEVEVVGAGDKGISAGEQSFLRGTEVRISRCEIGVAAKDRSEVRMNRLLVERGRLGFAIYQKKPEFGPALIDVRATRLFQLQKDYLLEVPSAFFIDRSPLPANTDRVEALLYGAQFGKASVR